MSNVKKQNLLFVLIDIVAFAASGFLVWALGISMVFRLSPRAILLHIVLGLLLMLMGRSLLGVYRQDWKKLSLYGLLRAFIAELLALFAHYFLQLLITGELLMFIHIFAVSAINLMAFLATRIFYFGYWRKRDSEKSLLLSSPTMHQEEKLFIEEAFDKNWIAPLGFNCDGFEKEMCDYLSAENAFATVSGTSAIHLAVKLAGIRPGERVFCTDMTFAATVNPICYEGGVPVFIDSEYETWNMDPAALEIAFAKYPEVRVVVLAHLYGTPAKMDEILAVCRKHHAILIEDSAEALGASYRGQKCGTFGEYNILSFNGNKIITTSGGGMLITKTAEARQKALFWSTQSRESAPWYQHEELGYNYRMSNVIAGIGRGQLTHLEDHKKAKTDIYHIYKDGLCGLPVTMNPYLACSVPNFWLSCLTIDPAALCPCTRTATTSSWEHVPGKTCPDELAKLLKENNIESRPIWKPMHMQPIFAEHDFITASSGTAVDEDIFARGICLPSDIKMTAKQQARIIDVIASAFHS